MDPDAVDKDRSKEMAYLKGMLLHNLLVSDDRAVGW